MRAVASGLLDHVFDEHLKHYGEPDMHYPFEDPSGKMPTMDVFVWHPGETLPMTTLATVGMSELTGENRSELHWTIRGKRSADEEAEAAVFLASLACFPRMRNTPLETWHIVKNLTIPGFSKCSSVLLHPALTEGGWDTIDWDGRIIKLHNVVPLTVEETDRALETGVADLLNRMYENKVDIFSDRV